jgi:hypothetical protein
MSDAMRADMGVPPLLKQDEKLKKMGGTPPTAKP